MMQGKLRALANLLFLCWSLAAMGQKDTVQFDPIFGQTKVFPTDSLIFSAPGSSRLLGRWKFDRNYCVNEGKKTLVNTKDTVIHTITFSTYHKAVFDSNNKIFWVYSAKAKTIELYNEIDEKHCSRYFAFHVEKLKRKKMLITFGRSQFKDASGQVQTCDRSLVVLRKMKRVRAMF